MFQLLDHTSAVGILARGANRGEALIEASRGLTSIIANPADFGPLEERYFKARGSDDAVQIINWLNEILFSSIPKGWFSSSSARFLDHIGRSSAAREENDSIWIAMNFGLQ